jgi:hypothetical protein
MAVFTLVEVVVIVVTGHGVVGVVGVVAVIFRRDTTSSKQMVSTPGNSGSTCSRCSCCSCSGACSGASSGAELDGQQSKMARARRSFWTTPLVCGWPLNDWEGEKIVIRRKKHRERRVVKVGQWWQAQGVVVREGEKEGKGGR